VAAIVFFCDGCLPIPYVERIASEVDGVVLDAAGKPMPGITMKRVTEFKAADHGKECSVAGDETVTDLQGRFRFGGEREIHPLTPLYGDPVWRVYFCAEVDGQMVPGWGTAQIGEPPARMSLACVTSSDGAACKCTPIKSQE
jgi:hypothetical protein